MNLDQFSTVSAALNAASDELSNSVRALDESLKRLNLGISSWTLVNTDVNGWKYYIGYTKVEKAWGIALRASHACEAEHVWLFGRAPRWLRIEALSKLPEMFEGLQRTVDATIVRMQKATALAQSFVDAIGMVDADTHRKSAVAGAIEDDRDAPPADLCVRCGKVARAPNRSLMCIDCWADEAKSG